jgi:hypothetical protein
LAAGKQIPIDFSIQDYDDGVKIGRVWLATSAANDNQWWGPYSCRGILTLCALTDLYADNGAYFGPFGIAAADKATGANGLSGKSWISWDEAALYFTVEIADDTYADNDNVEIYIDWNAGKGGVGEAELGFPYFQVAINRNGTIGGLSMEDCNPGNMWGGGMAWSGIWGTIPAYGDEGFEGNVEFEVTEIDGGWKVEVMIPVPAGVELTAGKQIPIDFSIQDYDEGVKVGRVWLAPSTNNDNQWWGPYSCRGVLTLCELTQLTAPQNAWSEWYAIAAADKATGANGLSGQSWISWNKDALTFKVAIADDTYADNDNVEIYIDWNAGGGGVGEAELGFPYFQVAVNRNGTIGGLSMEDCNPGNMWGGGMAWSGIWGTIPAYGDEGFEGNVEFEVTEVDGGWAVEVTIPVPAGVELTAGKEIPVDFSIQDYNEGVKVGRVWLAPSADNDNQWWGPYSCRGVLTLDED